MKLLRNLRIMAILMSVLMIPIDLYAQKIDELEQYELRSYSPVNYGLKDLVFEVRISNLVDLLKNQMAMTNIIDVYYRVFWIFPGQYRIEVEGLPRGFEELKAELRQLLMERLEFVVPQSLASQLRSYKLSYKARGNPVIVQGRDDTNTRAVNLIELEFEPNGKLRAFEAFSPGSRSQTSIDSSVKPWSHNKWVVDRLITTQIVGTQKTIVETKVSYTTVAGIGLPEKVDVETTHTVELAEEVKSGIKAEDIPSVKSGSTFLFSKYEVNTGKAQRVMVQGSSR
jgi:hypothetical protein